MKSSGSHSQKIINMNEIKKKQKSNLSLGRVCTEHWLDAQTEQRGTAN